MERLQKVIAQSNVASRREAEKMIVDGRVAVNGKVITELGTKVNRTDRITVDGKVIKVATKKYLLLNKPTGYLSTTKDDKKRRTIIDLISTEYKDDRLYPVGRLDYDTAGLILLTNDGELTLKLTNPEMELEKEYFVRVKGIVIRKKIVELRNGISIGEKQKIKPIEVNLIELDKENQSTLIRLLLVDDKNEDIRKMMEVLGFPVKNITRTSYSFLTLEGVKRGGYRELSVHEVRKLHSIGTKK
ncbi:pseudouridine synthase [Haploplasma axanthum]|uniref:Pseudouridine synthase n=1 Tax=Haploplasma axanthum TaxID=29552 RepID=A0A449BE34_HAPAX|nr:pseudouridine synthase [Haploplasma axanthum]VEU80692.1 pseudouridine synthase family protein [Haploplasma axanthum]